MRQPPPRQAPDICCQPYRGNRPPRPSGSNQVLPETSWSNRSAGCVARRTGPIVDGAWPQFQGSAETSPRCRRRAPAGALDVERLRYPSPRPARRHRGYTACPLALWAASSGLRGLLVSAPSLASRAKSRRRVEQRVLTWPCSPMRSTRRPIACRRRGSRSACAVFAPLDLDCHDLVHCCPVIAPGHQVSAPIIIRYHGITRSRHHAITPPPPGPRGMLGARAALNPRAKSRARLRG